jgi:hypothetical protein
MFYVRGQYNLPALKVPRQCLFVLLVEVRLYEGKSLRSGLCYERMEEVEQGLHYV